MDEMLNPFALHYSVTSSPIPSRPPLFPLFSTIVRLLLIHYLFYPFYSSDPYRPFH